MVRIDYDEKMKWRPERYFALLVMSLLVIAGVFAYKERDVLAGVLLNNTRTNTPTFNSTSMGDNGQFNAPTISFSHTTSGSNRLLFVSESTHGGVAGCSAVTYGGQNLTFLDSTSTGAIELEVWYLVNPPSGANTVFLSGCSNGTVVAVAESFMGVNQTTPLGTLAKKASTISPTSVTVSSAANELVADFFAVASFIPTADSSQTTRFENGNTQNANAQIGGSTKAGAASVTMQWSHGGNYTALLAVPIRGALPTAKINASQANLVPNGLVGYWSFNGPDISGTTAYDRSGQGNNGTLENTPEKIIGKSGQALNFFPHGGDTNARVNIGDPASGALDFGSGDFSISFFMRNRGFVDQTSSANVALSKKANDSPNSAGYVFIYDSSNDLQLRVGNGTTEADITSPSSIADGKWHLITGVRSGTTVTLYVDGVSTGTPGSISGSTSNSDNLIVGSDDVGGNGIPRNANADIDEVRAYNRALSVSEIKQLYQSGAATLNASQNTQSTNGLVGMWSFNGPDMNWNTMKALDRSGNSNDGTFMNMATKTAIVAGKVGQALQFDGVDDYVSAGSAASLDNLGPMSISAWIKPSSYSYGVMVAKGWVISSNAYGWAFSLDPTGSGNSRVGFWVDYNATVLKSESVNGSLNLNTWQHVAVTWDGSQTATNVHLYVNGTEVSYAVQINGVGTYDSASEAGTDLRIGRDSSTAGQYSGTMDEVRVYNRVLSQAEIKQLYNQGR